MRFVKKKSSLILSGLFFLSFLLNLIAWNSREFCDFYVKYIFPAWVNTYGRFTGLFSFSTGEIMLAVAVIAVVVLQVKRNFFVSRFISYLSSGNAKKSYFMRVCG